MGGAALADLQAGVLESIREFTNPRERIAKACARIMNLWVWFINPWARFVKPREQFKNS